MLVTADARKDAKLAACSPARNRRQQQVAAPTPHSAKSSERRLQHRRSGRVHHAGSTRRRGRRNLSGWEIVFFLPHPCFSC